MDRQHAGALSLLTASLPGSTEYPPGPDRREHCDNETSTSASSGRERRIMPLFKSAKREFRSEFVRPSIFAEEEYAKVRNPDQWPVVDRVSALARWKAVLLRLLHAAGPGRCPGWHGGDNCRSAGPALGTWVSARWPHADCVHARPQDHASRARFFSRRARRSVEPCPLAFERHACRSLEGEPGWAISGSI